MQADGLPADAETPTASNIQITLPPLPAGNLWTVTWLREYDGYIPYRNQQVTVMLPAETDAIQALSVAFPSSSPLVGLGPIMGNQALTVAAALLANENIPIPVLQLCLEAVVQPNTFRQSGGSATPQPNVAGQVAWDCAYSDADGNTDEVWIDTNSGTVIGGEIYGIAQSAPRKTTKALPVPKPSTPQAARPAATPSASG